MDTAFFLFVPDTCNPRPLSKFRGNAFAPLSLPLHRAALCRREFWHDKGSRRCCLHFGSVAGLSAKPPRSRRSAISLFPRLLLVAAPTRHVFLMLMTPIHRATTSSLHISPCLSELLNTEIIRVTFYRVIFVFSRFIVLIYDFSGRCKSSFEKKKNCVLCRQVSFFLSGIDHIDAVVETLSKNREHFAIYFVSLLKNPPSQFVE